MTEIKDMNVNELTNVVNLDVVTAWRIKRCIDAGSDSTKQPWERTGGVPLASIDWDLLETEWDPARGCSTSPSPCACQTAAITTSTVEGDFACKAIAANGIEQANEVIVADCLTNLGFPSAVSVQVDIGPAVTRTLDAVTSRHLAGAGVGGVGPGAGPVPRAPARPPRIRRPRFPRPV